MTFLRRHWPVFFFAIFAFAVFWQYFLLDQTFYAGDMAFALLPLCKYAMQRLAVGELPLWNPHLLAGTPGLAEATHQTFYPPNVLLLLIGTERGMGWLMPLHLFWMALGVYLFMRCALQMGKWGATFGALGCAFSGLMLGGLSIPVYINAASWLPWIFLAYEKSRADKAWIAWAGVCVALQLLSGGATYAYYTLAFLLVYHVFHDFALDVSPTPARRGWWTLALTLVIAVGLSAAQIVPQAELALQSERGTRSTYEYVIYGSLQPQHFSVTSLFPGFYGLFDSPTREGFLPTAELAYMGVPILICIFIAVLISTRRRAVWFWLGAGILALTFSFGQYNPLYPFLYDWIPGFASFRWPTRWLVCTVFAGAMLAGLGIEALQQFPTRGRLDFFKAIGAGVSVTVAGTLWLLFSNAPDAAKSASWLYVGLAAFVTVLLALLPSGREYSAAPIEAAKVRQSRARWVVIGLFGVLAADLWWLAQSMELQHTLSVAALESQPATAKFLADRSPRERFWALSAPMPLESWQAGANNVLPLEFRGRSAALLREMMPSCMSSEFGALGLTGAWGSLMPTRRHAQPLYAANTPDAVRDRWLRLLNARYRVALSPQTTPGLQSVTKEVPFIYRDDSALPRAFFVNQARSLAAKKVSEVISTGILDGKNFDPRRTVLLEGASENDVSSVSGVLPTVSVQSESTRPENINLQFDATSAGYVVFMDTAYPGWHAYLDNAPVAWEPANWVGRAVSVPAGRHEVRWMYNPQSVRLGIFISLMTLMFLSGAAATSWRARR